MSDTPQVDYVSDRAILLTNDRVINPKWSGGILSDVRYLLVHHDAQVATKEYNARLRYQNQARLHNTWGYGTIGLQYHFRINTAGRIARTRPLNKMLYHAGNYQYNKHGIAICVDGYFHDPHNQYMTREQYESLWQLINWLRSEYNLPRSRVLGHRQVGSTACNGDNAYPFVTGYRSNGKLDIPDHVDYARPDQQPVALVQWEPMDNQQEWYAVRDTKIYNLPFMEVAGTIEKGTGVELRTKTTHDGATYLRSKWATSEEVDHGILRDDMTRSVPWPRPEPEPPKIDDPSMVEDFEPGIFISNDKVKLYDIKTGEVIKDDFAVGTEFSIVQKAIYDGDRYLITEYSADRDLLNGLLYDGENLRRKQADDKPPDHEDDPKGDPKTDLEDRVSKLEDIVSRVVEFLQSVFNKFKK